MTKVSKAKDVDSPLDAFMQAIKTTGTQMGPGFAPDVMAAMQDAGAHMLSFMIKRVEHDLETQQALMKAKGIAEVQKIQSEFMKKAMDDYTTAVMQLMDPNKNHKRHATPV